MNELVVIRTFAVIDVSQREESDGPTPVDCFDHLRLFRSGKRSGGSTCTAPIPPGFSFKAFFSKYMIEYGKGESGDAVVRAVAAQRSARHRDTSDARSRQVEARMEALAFARVV